jgi:hypothetical protein
MLIRGSILQIAPRRIHPYCQRRQKALSQRRASPEHRARMVRLHRAPRSIQHQGDGARKAPGRPGVMRHMRRQSHRSQAKRKDQQPDGQIQTTQINGKPEITGQSHQTGGTKPQDIHQCSSKAQKACRIPRNESGANLRPPLGHTSKISPYANSRPHNPHPGQMRRTTLLHPQPLKPPHERLADELAK